MKFLFPFASLFIWSTTHLVGQINVAEIEVETSATIPERARANVAILPSFLNDPDGVGFPTEVDGSPVDVDAGLVGRWDFEGGDTDAAYEDQTPSGNDLSEVGAGQVLLPGGVSQVLSLNGAGEVYLEDLSGIGGGRTEEFTISLWFKINDGALNSSGPFGDEYQVLFRLDDYFRANFSLVLAAAEDPGGNGFLTLRYRRRIFDGQGGLDLRGIQNGGVFAQNRFLGNGSFISGPDFDLNYFLGSGIDDGQWHHVVLTYDRNDRTQSGPQGGPFDLYLDGSLDAAPELTQLGNVPWLANSPPTIQSSSFGAFNGTSIRFGYGARRALPNLTRDYLLEGCLDRIRLYNRELPVEEVRALFGQNLDGDEMSDRDEILGGFDPRNGASDSSGPNIDEDQGLPNNLPNLVARWDFQRITNGGIVDRAPNRNNDLELSGGIRLDEAIALPSVSAQFSGSELATAEDLEGLNALDNYSVSFWVRMGEGSAFDNLGESTALWALTRPSTVNDSVLPDPLFMIRTLPSTGIDVFELSRAVEGVDRDGRNIVRFEVLGSWSLPPGLNFADNDWHHVTFSRNGDSGEVFVDGASLGAESLPEVNSGDGRDFTIGGVSNPALSGTIQSLEGHLDRFRVWNSPLTSDQASDLYEQDFDGDGIPDYVEVASENSGTPLDWETPDDLVFTDPTFDEQGINNSSVTNNLLTHWNFESLRFDDGGSFFENQADNGNILLRPNASVRVGSTDALASNYAIFRGEEFIDSESLGNGLGGSSWAIAGWTRVVRDSIWNTGGAPTPFWEIRNVNSGADGLRFYAQRAGRFTAVVLSTYNLTSGRNNPENQRIWFLPRDLRLDDENWHHLVLNRDSGQFTLHIDGEEIATNDLSNVAVSINSNRNPILRLGHTFFSGAFEVSRTFGLNGCWDRFRVYSDDLSPALISALYNQDADGDGDPDWIEYGTPGRNALVDEGEDAPEATPPGTNLDLIDQQGLPPSLLTDETLAGSWDFEVLEATDLGSAFPDFSSCNNPMVAEGPPRAVGKDDQQGVPSRAAFVRDGAALVAEVDCIDGEEEFTASFWVRTTGGLLERSGRTGFGLISLEDLLPSVNANTLSLRLQRSGLSQSLVLQTLGTSSGFIRPGGNILSMSLEDRRLDDGDWHHITWVRELSGSRFYVDGVLLTRVIGVSNENPTILQRTQSASAQPRLVLGRTSARAPELAMDGHYDRVRLYRRALSAAEARSLYQQDFDGDGFSDIFELNNFGFDPFQVTREDAEEVTEDDTRDFDDDQGLTNSDNLAGNLVAAWNFESLSSSQVGDERSSLRFTAQRPAGVRDALTEGGATWDQSQGMLSRSLALTREGVLNLPAEVWSSRDETSLSLWIRMNPDEISSQAGELEVANNVLAALREKVALMVVGESADSLPRVILSLDGEQRLVVESNFVRDQSPTVGYTRTLNGRWDSPAKLDDGRWHHIVLNLEENRVPELIVDGFPAELGSGIPDAPFTGFQSISVSADPYFWIGFEERNILEADNVLASSLPYRGFGGSIDRLRLYTRNLSEDDAEDLYFQDQDGDSIPDVTEVNSRLDPFEALSPVLDSADYDQDGLSRTQEEALGTEWRRPDSDGDWLFDGWENLYSDSFRPDRNDRAFRELDQDGDSLTGFEEFLIGTNPNDDDTDNDGANDNAEVASGSNPLDSNSRPLAGGGHGRATRGDRLLPGGTFDGEPYQPSGATSFYYNGQDGTGPRYRKVSFSGRPLPDQAPETEAETDEHKEEQYIDAFNLNLNLDHSLVYVPIAASELTLQATLSYRSETWNNRSGIRPDERVTQPFGPCWTTNLCAYVEEIIQFDNSPDDSPTPDADITYNVIDENGRSLRFGSYDGQTIFSYPSTFTDRKTYFHELNRDSADTLVLRKKFGCEVTYQLVDLDQAYVGNRAGVSGSSFRHRYYRLTKVEDRYGNELRYVYPSGHNQTLIPRQIIDPDRPEHQLTITVNPLDPHQIAGITDSRAYQHQFTYTNQSWQIPGPASIGGGQRSVEVLSGIIDPDNYQLGFGYDLDTETDAAQEPAANITNYYALDINSLTDKRGVRTSLVYERDDDKFAVSVVGLNREFRRIYGLPRLVSRVNRGITIPTGFVGGNEVGQTAQFSRRDGLRWIYSADGVTITRGGSASIQTQDWFNEIRDGEGNLTTYCFRDPEAILADTAVRGFASNPDSVSYNWFVYYQQMDILHPAGIGREVYNFDLNSGLSLSQTTDLSGNTTTYQYTDNWGGLSLATNPFQDQGRFSTFSRWSDPTRKVDGEGRVETFSYSPHFRTMDRHVDVYGTVREYEVDDLGRRLSMEARDSSGLLLRRELYEYSSLEFPAFMTRKVVQAYENLSTYDWEDDIITLYEPDENGRIARMAIDINRDGVINDRIGDGRTGDLVTEYAYNAHNAKTAVTDPRGNTTTFVYDRLNRLHATIYPPADGASRGEQAEMRNLHDPNGNIHAIIDENGFQTIQRFDGLNRLRQSIRDIDGVSLATTLTSFTNTENQQVTPLDWLGRESQATPADLVTRIDYNDVDSTTFVTDPRGIVTHTDYDAIQRPVRVWQNYRAESSVAAIAEAGDQTLTEYIYDNSRNTGGSVFNHEGFKPTTTTYRNAVGMSSDLMEDVVVEMIYDGVYRPISTITTFDYQGGAPRTTTTDTLYDDPNYTVTQILAAGAGESNRREIRTEMDGLGRTLRVIDDVGGIEATTQTSYSSTGFPWRVIDAEGREMESDFDAAGRPVKKWDPQNELAIGQPGFGLVDRNTDESDEVIGSPTTLTFYDGNSNVIRQVNPRQEEWTTEFDARNRTIRQLEPSVPDASAGNTQSRPSMEFFYNGTGQVLTTIDQRGSIKRCFYDQAYRKLFSRVNPDDGDPSAAASLANNPQAFDITTSWTYDPNSNVLSETDGNGNTTRNRYDALNRLTVTVTDPEDGDPSDPNASGFSGRGESEIVVENFYDDLGNLLRVTDGRGQVTGFRYDGLKRKTRTLWDEGQALQRTEECDYDGVVKISQFKPANGGERINMVYDGLHRMVERNYVDDPSDDRRYSYDDVNNLLEITYPNENSAGQALRRSVQSYDALNRVRTETSAGVTHALTYDKAGNRLTASYGNSSNRNLSCSYDALNRLATCQERLGGGAPRATTYGYNLAGDIVSKSLPNNVVSTKSYDFLGRKLSMTDRRGNAVLQSSNYSQPANGNLSSSYDNAHNLLRISETNNRSGVLNRLITNEYDSVYRLAREFIDEQGNGATDTTTDYGYDQANNLATKSIVKSGGTNSTENLVYRYGDGSILTGANSNQILGYGPVGQSESNTFDYDENGNRISETANGRTDVYVYDDDNRLVSLNFQTSNTASERGTYRYAYDHRTRRVLRDESGAGEARTELSFSGGVSVQEREGGTLRVEYIRGSDYGGGVGGILYTVRAGNTPTFNSYNSRGDVTTQTNGSGAIAWQGTYEAFGELTQEGGTNVERQRSNTKDRDPTGLINEGMRYRRQEFFLTRDPAGFIDGPNVYAYVKQNPWTYYDPLGLFWWSQNKLNPNHPSPYGNGVAKNVLLGIARVPGLVIQKFDENLFDPVSVSATGNTARENEIIVENKIEEFTEKMPPEAQTFARGGLVAASVRKGKVDTDGLVEKAKKAAKSFKEKNKKKEKKTQHGNTAGEQQAELYEKYDKNGDFRKHGVSQDSSKRYTKKELDGGEIVVTDKGKRKDMLRKEREKVEKEPGPDNKEPWAGSKKNE